MPLTLKQIAGFSDLLDANLAAELPARAVHLARIAGNAQFGMVRLEFFQDKYKDGDTVITPVSPIDQYPYSREELLYHWTIQNTHNVQTNWLTGPECLWFLSHSVDQETGEVHTEEWYRKSSVHNPEGAKSNDGVLLVTTIAQRQLKNIVLATAPTFQGNLAAAIGIDKPLTDDLLLKLSRGAKFSAFNTEFIYLGEFKNGDTVPQPISPADGHVYAYADCQFVPAWRWTTAGAVYKQPDNYLGQLQRMEMSVSSVGAVTTRIDYKGDQLAVYTTTHGRIAVFALCNRSTAGLAGGPFDDFSEIDNEFFLPGNPLRASIMAAINANILEASLSPEVFAKVTKTNGQTVSVPTAADAYPYTREELVYLSWLASTGPETGGGIRLPIFGTHVDRATGVVSLDTWRLPAGHPPEISHDGSLGIVVVGARQRQHPEIVAPADQQPDDPLPADAITGSLQFTLYENSFVVEPLFTPPVGRGGLYRITYQAKLTRAASISSVLGGTNGFQLHYTDDADGQAALSPPGPTDSRNTLAAQVSGVVLANITENTAVTFDFGYTNNGGTLMQYTLNVSWEEERPTGGPIIGGAQYHWLPGPPGSH